MIEAGIIGAAGYTGGELIRILDAHPEVSLSFLHSQSQTGEKLSTVHRDLFHLDMTFTDQLETDVDVIFLCMGHGRSATFMEDHTLPARTKVVDLSHDFRLNGAQGFVYGLPELQRGVDRKGTSGSQPRLLCHRDSTGSTAAGGSAADPAGRAHPCNHGLDRRGPATQCYLALCLAQQ